MRCSKWFSCSFVSTVLLALARCWLQPTPRAAVEALPHRRGVLCTAMSRCVLLLTDLNLMSLMSLIWSLMLFLHCFLTFLVCQEVTVFGGFPCWACQNLGPLHLRAFLSIPADSALPATLFLKDVSSQLATGTEQSSKVKHAYLISQIWSTPKKLHHFRLCYRKIIQLCSENKNWGGLLGSLHHGSKYRGLKCGRQKGPKGATTIHQEVWPNEGIGMFNVWQHVQYVEYLGCNRLKMFCLKHLAWLTHVWTPWRLGTFSV